MRSLSIGKTFKVHTNKSSCLDIVGAKMGLELSRTVGSFKKCMVPFKTQGMGIK